jgi:ribosome-binding ATPase YchF (GTP1/OBG family)
VKESELAKLLQSEGVKYLEINAEMEKEISEMTDENFKNEYLASFGFAKSAIPIIHGNFARMLGQGVFYTIGKPETRAWLYPKSSKLAAASAVIHSDFPKRFISADVIKVSEYLRDGKKAKSSLKTKEYQLEDGCDIVDFKIRK